MFLHFIDKVRECEDESSKIIVTAYEDVAKIERAAQQKIEEIRKAAQEEVVKKGKVTADSKPQTSEMPLPIINIDKAKLESAKKYILAEFNKRYAV